MKNHRSIRLKEYDYSQSGAYFVAVCTHNRACLCGEIVDGEMVLNDAGWIVQAVWDEIPEHVDHVELDQFVIMPNHIHGIIVLHDGIGAQHAVPLRLNDSATSFPGHCQPSSDRLNPQLQNTSMNYMKHRAKKSGNAIITNTSSATTMN